MNWAPPRTFRTPTATEDAYPIGGTLPTGHEYHGRAAGYGPCCCRCSDCRAYKAARARDRYAAPEVRAASIARSQARRAKPGALEADAAAARAYRATPKGQAAVLAYRARPEVKEAARSRARARRSTDLEAARARDRKRRALPGVREAIADAQRARYWADPEASRARGRARRAANPELHRARGRAWRRSPQGRAVCRALRHARREWEGEGTATDVDFRAVIEAADGHCFYCGCYVGDDYLEPDHVLSKVQNGTNDPWNLVAACRRCNRGPGGKFDEDVWAWCARTGARVPDVPSLAAWPRPEGWGYAPRTGAARFYRGAPPSDDPRWTPHLDPAWSWSDAPAVEDVAAA